MFFFKILLLGLFLFGPLYASPLSVFQPHRPFAPKQMSLHTHASASFSASNIVQSSSFSSPTFHSRLYSQKRLSPTLPLVVGLDYARQIQRFRAQSSGFSLHSHTDQTTLTPTLAFQDRFLSIYVDSPSHSDPLAKTHTNYDLSVSPFSVLTLGQYSHTRSIVWQLELDSSAESDTFLLDSTHTNSGRYITLGDTQYSFLRLIDTSADLDPLNTRNSSTLELQLPQSGDEIQLGTRIGNTTVFSYIQDSHRHGQISLIDRSGDTLGDLEGSTYHNAKGFAVSRKKADWEYRFNYDYKEQALLDADLSLQGGSDGFASLLGKYYTTEGLRSKTNHYTFTAKKSDTLSLSLGYSHLDFSGHYKDYDRIIF